MKKIFLVILAVCAAVSGFSQELKFDGYVNSGLGLWMSDQEDANGDTQGLQLMVYGVDSERNIGRFRLNGSFTNEAKTGGANFRIQAQGRGTGTNNPANALSLAFGYGWVKFLDMLTIKAGFVDDGTWATADVIFADDQGEGPGALFRLSPIQGLDLGFGAYAGNYGGGGDNNFLPRLDSQVRWDNAKYTYNAAYTMDKVFRFMASYRTHSILNGGGLSSQALAEFRLLMVDNLTAIVAAQIVGLQERADVKFDDNGTMSFFETIGYKISGLSFGLNAAQYASNVEETDISLRFNPWVSYALSEGKIVPRLDVVYFLGGRQDGTNYHRKGFSTAYNKDIYVING